MPRPALIETRPLLLASLAAALAWFALRGGETGELILLALKGGALMLLGAYALAGRLGTDSRLLGAMLLLSGLGSAVLDLFFDPGVGLLVAGLWCGIALFLRHPRPRTSFSQKAAALALFALTPAIAWSMAGPSGVEVSVAIYALVLGGLAAAAWRSAFNRYRIGGGAVMLVAAALVELARLRLLAGSALPALLAWPLYYFGHFLVCTGVTAARREEGRLSPAG